MRVVIEWKRDVGRGKGVYLGGFMWRGKSRFGEGRKEELTGCVFVGGRRGLEVYMGTKGVGIQSYG